jgi:hypothetical protein
VVRLNGQDFYRGPWGSKEATECYEALIAQWLANHRRLSDTEPVTVNELVLAFVQWAEGAYQDERKKSGEVDAITQPLKVARRPYEREPAALFAPRALKVVRQAMVDQGWCRNYARSMQPPVASTLRAGTWRKLQTLATGSSVAPTARIAFMVDGSQAAEWLSLMRGSEVIGYVGIDGCDNFHILGRFHRGTSETISLGGGVH